jgi:hypothetical protein
MLERVSAEVLAELERIAERARGELIAAGLPMAPTGVAPVLAQGFEIEVDDGADGGGVFLSWQCHPRLRDVSSRAYREARFNDPAFRHHGKVTDIVIEAMGAILTAAGFTVRPTEDEYRLPAWEVTAAPPRGTPICWGVRSEETTLTGWQSPTASPGGSES